MTGPRYSLEVDSRRQRQVINRYLVATDARVTLVCHAEDGVFDVIQTLEYDIAQRLNPAEAIEFQIENKRDCGNIFSLTAFVKSTIWRRSKIVGTEQITIRRPLLRSTW